MTRSAIQAMGFELGPKILEQCRALFDEEQQALAERMPVSQADVAYGSEARHRLDLYRPEGGDDAAPVLIFVHGGGFLKGDKGGADAWPNANVGRMAAQAGFLGVVINYRLLAGGGGGRGGGRRLAAGACRRPWRRC